MRPTGRRRRPQFERPLADQVSHRHGDLHRPDGLRQRPARIARRRARRIHGSSARRRRPQDGQGRRQLKQVTTLTGEYGGEEGLAWSRDSRSVFFAPAISNAQFDVAAVSVYGTPVVRQVAAGLGTLR